MIKEYLGDSVYAEFDGFDVILTTENGMGPSNTIYLEPELIKKLNLFLVQARQEATESKVT